MNKRILVVSIFAAVLIALLPMSSVIGINVVKSNAEETTITSPLFANRVNSYTQKNSDKMTTNYLGKGNLLNLYLSRQSTYKRMVNRAIKLIETRPYILNTMVERIETDPQIMNILTEHELSVEEVKNQISLIKNDPSLLRNIIENPGDDPQPLGLSTSSAIGCFFVAIALIPVILILTVMIATLTIVTCLNIGGCFESLFEQIGQSIFEGLNPP